MKQQYIEQKVNIGNLQIHVLLSDGFFNVDAPWSMPLHAHAMWEMHYIYRGSVTFDAQNVPMQLTEGTLAIVPPYQYHCVKGHSADLCKTSLIFSLSENKTVEDASDQFHYYTGLLQNRKQLILLNPQKAYYQDLLGCITEYNESGQLHLELFGTLLKMIFLEIAEEISSLQQLPKPPRSTFVSEDSSENMIRKKQAEDFIYRRFQDQITVEDLANHLHLSVRQTNRFLNENMHIGFHEFVCQYRMQMARTLLAEYHREPQEVAYAVGYQSYHGFAEAFKKMVGMTPARYLAAVRED